MIRIEEENKTNAARRQLNTKKMCVAGSSVLELAHFTYIANYRKQFTQMHDT